MTEFESKIVEHILEIKTDIGGVQEHLKTLNSKVATNVQAIEKNRIAISENDIIISKWVGGLCALTFIGNYIAFYLFK